MRSKFDVKRGLGGRSLLHPDIAHFEALREGDARECEAIDALHAKMHARRSTTGIGAERRDKLTGAQRSARDAKTVHDAAATNPILRELLRSLQRLS